MENTLSGVDDADIHIDDVGEFSKDWKCDIQLLSDILHHLCENGFAINPLK